MNEFWINNGWYFIMFGIAAICITLFTLHYYTGSVKKLDLIINDIKTIGHPRKEVLMFNKFADKHNLDPYRMSTFTHLIYFIPKLTQDPALYKSNHFIEQVGVVTFYRNLYKITLCLIIADIAFICVMTYLFGQNIK